MIKFILQSKFSAIYNSDVCMSVMLVKKINLQVGTDCDKEEYEQK